MRRHPVLQPLSREHLPALLLARDLLEAAHDLSSRRALAARVLAAWQADLVAHFDAEEAWFLPLLPEGELRSRLLHDHEVLRRLFAALAHEPPPESEDLVALGALLRAHVRWEERVLFPRLEPGLVVAQGAGAP